MPGDVIKVGKLRLKVKEIHLVEEQKKTIPILLRDKSEFTYICENQKDGIDRNNRKKHALQNKKYYNY